MGRKRSRHRAETVMRKNVKEGQHKQNQIAELNFTHNIKENTDNNAHGAKRIRQDEMGASKRGSRALREQGRGLFKSLHNSHQSHCRSPNVMRACLTIRRRSGLHDLGWCGCVEERRRGKRRQDGNGTQYEFIRAIGTEPAQLDDAAARRSDIGVSEEAD